MADRLEALLKHFAMNALCGVNELPAVADAGQLHLVQAGRIEVSNEGEPALLITDPSRLLYPRPMKRRFVTDAERGADLARAN